LGCPGFRFEKGDAVEIDSVLYAILSTDSDGTLLRSLGASRTQRLLKHEEFWDLYRAGGRLKVRREIAGVLPVAVMRNLDRPHEGFDARSWEETLTRLDYVEFCDRFFSPAKTNRRGRFPANPKGFRRIADFVARLRRRRVAQATGTHFKHLSRESFSGSTVRDWYKRWARSGREMSALVPCHDAKGSFGSNLDGDVLEIMGRWIRERYLTEERPDMSIVYDAVAGEIEKKNEQRVTPLSVPSYDTFRRCIRQWVTPYDLVCLRQGEKKAKNKFGHNHRAPQPLRPLEIVEIDHTPLDLLLVDDDGMRSRGDRRKKVTYRVWLTLARCQMTKMVFGFHLSRDQPSWTSVMCAMKMGVGEKVLDGIDVRSPWPVFGVPEVLKMDNGPEFHSKSLRAAAGQLRMELRRMPRKTPHMKGGIERTIGIVSRDFLGFLPGRLFSNPQVRGDYDSQGRAAVDFEKLQELLTIYIVDILHNKPMGVLLGRTPLMMWESFAGYNVRMPPDPADLDAVLALTIDRTVTKAGITFLGLIYRSPQLSGLRKRAGHIGKMLMVKVDPMDLGSVLVLDESDGNRRGRWIEVPCEYPELSDGVSVVEWKETVSLARDRTEEGRRVALSTLRAARLLLAEEAARLSPRRRKRVSQADVDWASRHAGDPVFDVSPDGEGHSADSPMRSPRRGRKKQQPGEVRDVGEGGHVPSGTGPAAETAPDPELPESWDDEDGAGPDGTDIETGAAPDEENPAGKVDYEDPENWDD
jgi:putative transposase